MTRVEADCCKAREAPERACTGTVHAQQRGFRYSGGAGTGCHCSGRPAVMLCMPHVARCVGEAMSWGNDEITLDVIEDD